MSFVRSPITELEWCVHIYVLHLHLPVRSDACIVWITDSWLLLAQWLLAKSNTKTLNLEWIAKHWLLFTDIQSVFLIMRRNKIKTHWYQCFSTCESRERLTQFDQFLSNLLIGFDLLIGVMPNQCNLPISSPQWDIGLIGQNSNKFTSPNRFTGKDIKALYYVITCVSEQSHRQYDAAVSPAAIQRVRSDPTNPASQRGGLGSPNHIKESIKIKPRPMGHRVVVSRHVMWRSTQRSCIMDVM
jgi:hypothetical protein